MTERPCDEAPGHDLPLQLRGRRHVDDTKPNMWSVHAWNTPKFATAFKIEGQATVSIFTTTIGGAAGRGLICATVLDRSVSGGVPTDTVLGSGTYDLASWPTDLRRISFSFNVSTTTIAADPPPGAGDQRALGVHERPRLRLRPPPVRLVPRGGNNHAAVGGRE